jgi:colicin import membrane protein
LGEIRRAAEKVAADKAAAERDELMKKAQSKRADDETRERAQRAKAEMVGQQQAVAANKALAATLGGKDSKWSKWGGGGSGGSAAGNKIVPAASETAAAASAAEDASASDGGAAFGRGGDVDPMVVGGDSTDIQLQDLIVVLQQDPLYCKSNLLYRLLNGMG